MASKSSKRSAAPKSAVFRLNRTTAYIILGGAVLAALAWFLFARPAAQKLNDAREQREQAEVIQQRLEQEVAALGDGNSFSAAELPGIVGPVEAMLPNGGSPTDAVDRIQNAATSNGVSVDSSSFPSNYSAPENGKTQATFTVDASGPLDSMAAWLSAVRLDAQLITAEVTAVTTNAETGRATMSITFTVWATDQETWADGLDQAAGTPGLTPEQVAEAMLPIPTEGG